MSIPVTYSWTCTQCDETGDTDAGAERHCKKAGHVVWSKAVPS